MLKFFKRHKIISGLVVLGIIGGGYYLYAKTTGNKTETRYVVEAVDKGTIITTISGSGQISSSNQVEIKPKVSGDVIKVAVKEGQEVKANEVLVQLDPKDAQKALRDAQTSLQSSRLALQKMKEPATAYSIMQAENALTNAKDTLEKLKLSQKTEYEKAESDKAKAENDLAKAYEDAFNAVSATFLNLPGIITGLDNMLYSNEISNSESNVGNSQWNTSALLNTTYTDYRDNLQVYQVSAESDYKTARAKYDANFTSYKNASRYSDKAVIESLLAQTLETAKSIAQAAKSENNYFDVWSDYRSKQNWSIFSKVTTYKTNLASYTSQINSNLTTLLTVSSSLQSNKDTISDTVKDLQRMEKNQPLDLTAATNSVKEKEGSLAELKAGADALDIRTQELAVAQKQNAVVDALQQLSDYTIKAPFDGKIAVVGVAKGDSASSGTSVVTLIAPQMVAELSLNEVDAAKVATGQKATLTFDALSDLEVTGKVAQVDTVGTVSQGVVTYTVKIALDTNDEKIKVGMSVNANIITEAKQDIVIVPSAAIKTAGNETYVEVPSETIDSGLISSSSVSGLSLTKAPERKIIQAGITDNTYTEVVSGLTAGDYVITSTIVTTNVKKTTAKSLISFGGQGGMRNSSGSSTNRNNSGSSRGSSAPAGGLTPGM